MCDIEGDLELEHRGAVHDQPHIKGLCVSLARRHVCVCEDPATRRMTERATQKQTGLILAVQGSMSRVYLCERSVRKVLTVTRSLAVLVTVNLSRSSMPTCVSDSWRNSSVGVTRTMGPGDGGVLPLPLPLPPPPDPRIDENVPLCACTPVNGEGAIGR